VGEERHVDHAREQEQRAGAVQPADARRKKRNAHRERAGEIQHDVLLAGGRPAPPEKERKEDCDARHASSKDEVRLDHVLVQVINLRRGRLHG
jgi:sRNA-binding protein